MNDVRCAVVIEKAFFLVKIQIEPHGVINAVAVTHPWVVIAEYQKNDRVIARIYIFGGGAHVLHGVFYTAEVVVKYIHFSRGKTFALNVIFIVIVVLVRIRAVILIGYREAEIRTVGRSAVIFIKTYYLGEKNVVARDAAGEPVVKVFVIMKCVEAEIFVYVDSVIKPSVAGMAPFAVITLSAEISDIGVYVASVIAVNRVAR